MIRFMALRSAMLKIAFLILGVGRRQENWQTLVVVVSHYTQFA
jgi:hypothetical protein